MLINNLKQSLLELYPELGKLNGFGHLVDKASNTLDPRYRKLIRVTLPLLTIATVLFVGIYIGQVIINSLSPKPFNPPQIPTISPTITSEYTSPYQELKDSVSSFDPSIPDPIPPVLDYDLSLEIVRK